MNKKEANTKIKELETQLQELREIVNKPEDLFSTITSYEDVCEALNQKPFTLGMFSHLPMRYREKALAQAQIQQIEELINSGWETNWADSSQRKWYPYFEYKSSGGLVFFGSVYCCSRFTGQVGFYKDEKTASFVGRTFIEIYKKLL